MLSESMIYASSDGSGRPRKSKRGTGVIAGVNLTAFGIESERKKAMIEGPRTVVMSDGTTREFTSEFKKKDPTTRGLLLVTKSNGQQEWRYRYKQHGKDKTMVLGKLPTMTLASARLEAQKARQRVEAGEDIHEAKRAARQPFSLFLDTFYDRWRIGKRVGSIATTKPRVEVLKERLGPVPVSMVTTGRIAAALDGLPETTANRCLHICQQALRIAKVQGAVSANEARELKASDLNSAPKVKTPRTSMKLADVMPSIEKVVERSQVAADVLKLVALTAMRIEETVSLEWRDVDFSAKVLNVRAENRKGKLDVRHPLTLPLSDPAFSVLSEIAQRKLSARWVFPGNLSRHIDRRSVLHNLKLVAPTATLHGFRSLFSTETNDAGFEGIVVEVALGHVIKGVKGVYDKGQRLEQRRALMQWWGNRIMGNGIRLVEFPAAASA